IPLAVVSIQQTRGRPAVYCRGEFPAEVHRVLQTEVQARTAHRGMHMRGIADQEDASRTVTVGLPAVLPGDAAHRVRPVTGGCIDRQVDAEDSPGAVAQL